MRSRVVALATLPVAIALIAAYVFTSAAFAPTTAVQAPLRQHVGIGDSVVTVELATSSAAREKGLGDRDGLAPDTGMLFVFPRDGSYAFWMKDMRFAIDIIWLDAAGEIVTIRSGISPDTYPTVFSPSGPARFVLELPAGYARAHKLALGQRLRLPDTRATE